MKAAGSRAASGRGKDRSDLRTGFSTGTAASAAAGAALIALLTGEGPENVVVDLPQDGPLSIDVAACCAVGAEHAWATVIKDAGDDPDVTDKAAVSAAVEIAPDLTPGQVEFRAGEGVGRVTKPGLPVEVGQAAINPVPRLMIAAALAKAWQSARPGEAQPGFIVTISVAGGEELARHTLNPRLGIVGGISILGTTGLVKPFSHEAYTATIDSGLDVARALGATEAVLTTGGKSEKLAMKMRPDLPETAFVQIADFFGHALRSAVGRGMEKIGLVSFFGKAVKQAQGLDYTHAHKAPMELEPVARWLASAGAEQSLCDEVARANTARHALDLLREDNRLDLVEEVGRRMFKSMEEKVTDASAGQASKPELWAAILDHDGTVLYRSQEGGKK